MLIHVYELSVSKPLSSFIIMDDISVIYTQVNDINDIFTHLDLMKRQIKPLIEDGKVVQFSIIINNTSETRIFILNKEELNGLEINEIKSFEFNNIGYYLNGILPSIHSFYHYCSFLYNEYYHHPHIFPNNHLNYLYHLLHS